MKLVFAFAALVALAAPASAQISCQTYGNTGATFCSGPNGYTAWQQDYGHGASSGGDNGGNRWTTQDYGNGSSFTSNMNVR